MKTKFELVEWQARGEELLKEAQKALANAPSAKMKELSKCVPKTMTLDNKPIKVVFAGQYSSGKSSLIKALTGREDVKIGAGIVTGEFTPYDYQGIQVCDTPGIHTKLRPDHDEITYKSISESDLIVYVITYNLFDDPLARNFRKLAIERSKGHEILLVVNKMTQSQKGNTSEMQNIICQDLEKVLFPLSPEDLYISFTDAESYLDAKLEQDESTANILYKRSRIDEFIVNLNHFVRDKGITGRFTTSLYQLEHILTESLSAESSGDEDADALMEILLQKRRAILETKEKVRRSAEGEINNTVSRIRQKGASTTDYIHKDAKEDLVNDKIKEAQGEADRLSEELEKRLKGLFEESAENLMKNLGDLGGTEFAKKLFSRLENRIKRSGLSSKDFEKIKKTGSISDKLGNFLVTKSYLGENGLKGISKLANYSGSEAHKVVLSVGNFFGKNFKPWEAVKWTKGIANAGRWLGVAGTILSVIGTVWEENNQEKLEVNLLEARTNLRSGFNEVANEVELHYDETLKLFIAKTLDPELVEIDSQLKEIREIQEVRSELFISLSMLLSYNRELIKEMYEKNE